jgi:hypothetical protein
MAGLAEAVQGAVGQPASVRIGLVESINPTVITAQGVAFNDVGLLGGYVPQVGDSVALLGQCSETGSDPASWLALGAVQAGSASVPQSVSAAAAASASTSSTSYVTTAVICQTTFVAAPSGRALMSWRAGILTSGGVNQCFVAPQIEDSNGAIFWTASDTDSINTPFGSTLQFGASTLVESLTPGETYTVTLMQRTSNAVSAALAVNREVVVSPAP